MSSRAGDPLAAPVDVTWSSAPTDAASAQELWWDRLRLALVIAWLLLAAAVIGFGERTAPWQEVRGLVVSGEVDRVRVVGELPSGSTGYGVVEIGWRHGLIAHRAEVVHVRGSGEVREARTAAGEGVPLLRSSPTVLLRDLQPGLAVTHQQRTSHGELLGWRVPGPLALAAFGLFLAWLGFLVTGPQPWRATRWAWFWLAIPPVGVLAHLLLSGPTPGIPAPRRPERRLTGGWAFLVYVAVTAALVNGG